MKQRFCVWILMSILCLCTFGRVAVGEAETVLLVYMVGSDLESENGLAAKDLEEMQKHFPQSANVKLLVCLGGAKEWSISVSPDVPTVYSLDSEGLHEMQSLSTRSMTSTEALNGFLRYAYEYVPCENTALVLWNHGSGPLIGFGVDETVDNDKLTFTEMREAFFASPYKGENKLKWIGFDACLMGSLEMAAMLEPYADYLIASEEVELPCGWDYSFVSLLGDGLDTLALSSQILQRFYQTSVDACGGDPVLMPSITLAAYDLSKCTMLVHSLEKLLEQMHTTLEFGGFAQMARVRAGIDKLGRFSGGLTTDLVDLGQLIDMLLEAYPDVAQKVLEQMEVFVVGCATNNPQYSGLSVYFPYDDKAMYLSYGVHVYSMISFSEMYTEFVKRFAEDWLSGNLVQTPILQGETQNNRVGIQLADQLLNTYESAQYVVLMENEGGYNQCYSGNDVLVENGFLYADYRNQAAYLVQEATGRRICVGLEYLSESEQYWHYRTKVVLSRGYIRGGHEAAAAWITIAISKQSLIGFVVGSYYDNEELYGKRKIDFSEWECLTWMTRSKTPTWDEKGNFLEFNHWELKDAYVYSEIILDKPFHIEISSIMDVTDPLYIQYSVRDIYGNVWNSDLIEIKTKTEKVLEELVYTEVLWEDVSQPLVLKDNEIMRLELHALGRTGYNGGLSFQLHVESYAEFIMDVGIRDIAVDRYMIGSLFRKKVFPGRKAIIPVSLSPYPFEFQDTYLARLLQFEVFCDETNWYYGDDLYTELFSINLNQHELKSMSNEENMFDSVESAAFQMKDMMLFENEYLLIEAVPINKALAWKQQISTVFLKIRNKSNYPIHIDANSVHVNGVEQIGIYGTHLLPQTWTYFDIDIDNSKGILIPNGNELDIDLEWSFGYGDGKKIKLDHIILNVQE